MNVAFSNYLNRMSVDGTFGAEITLRAVANWLVSDMPLCPLSAEQLKQLYLHKNLHRNAAFIWDTAENNREHYVKNNLSLMNLLILK